jgi:putative peptidoglycan lipid II flippase
LPRLLGIDQRWGTAGLTLSAGIAGWLEFLLLRRALHRRVGAVPAAGKRIALLSAVAILSAVIGYGLKLLLPFHAALIIGPCVLIPYAVIYLTVTRWMGIASMGAIDRIFKRKR